VKNKKANDKIIYIDVTANLKNVEVMVFEWFSIYHFQITLNLIDRQALQVL